MYRAQVVSRVKGSGCFVLKFTFPPFSPPLPTRMQIPKHNMHTTYDPINTLTPALEPFAPQVKLRRFTQKMNVLRLLRCSVEQVIN